MKILNGYEEKIVWEVDISELPYVREYVDHFCHDRSRPVSWSGNGRLVGYSVLSKDAPSKFGGVFVRRVFWLSEDDPYTKYPWVPVEAVDPRRIAPNQSAELTPIDFLEDSKPESVSRTIGIE